MLFSPFLKITQHRAYTLPSCQTKAVHERVGGYPQHFQSIGFSSVGWQVLIPPHAPVQPRGNTPPGVGLWRCRPCRQKGGHGGDTWSPNGAERTMQVPPRPGGSGQPGFRSHYMISNLRLKLKGFPAFLLFDMKTMFLFSRIPKDCGL